MNSVFLGIGTNLGNREGNIAKAVSAIETSIGKVKIASSIYETEPWGFQTYDQFLNQVVTAETTLGPQQVLEKIHQIEALLGRVRGESQYISRVIDIDMLFFNNDIVNETGLQIPHPLLHERKFVLVPLCEIAPDMRHPVSGKTIAELLEECGDKSEVIGFRPA